MTPRWFISSDSSCSQWLFLHAMVSSSHLSAPLSLNYCSTVEIRCNTECLPVPNCGVWPTNGWDCDINISCEDSDTFHHCCKFILKVGFLKNFEFQFIFEDLRVLKFERVDGVFPTFSSYIYVSPFLFLPAPETNPKQHITTTKYNKSRILRYFMIFISFWKRFEHKRKIPYIYYINHM